MDKTVLIIDDDLEFTTLLKGIYEQADYTVYTAENSDGAFEEIRQNNIQLVVADQRLPGELFGSDIIKKFREMGLDVSIIMVSGYLDDDTIRELIREGVEGVFIKPLNIFSLLKKSSEILEKRAKGKQRKLASSDMTQTVPGMGIGQIEGLSEKGREFTRRAREAASFKRNLLLIGPSGTLLEEISRDIVALSGNDDRLITYKPGQVSRAVLDNHFEGEDADRPITLVLLEAESLSAEEVDQLIAFGDERGGSASSLRMVFCLGQSVESLYDQEKIDEELYLFLGSNELQVPPLKEMPEDLVAFAKREILKLSAEASFDMRLRSFILDYDWPENMLELRSVIVRAASLSQPLPPTVRHFRAALNPVQSGGSVTDGARSSLERFLKNEKSRYITAIKLLRKT